MSVRVWLPAASFLTLAICTCAYWTGVLSLVGLAPWLKQFPYISPFADIWMGGTGALAAIGLFRRKRWGWMWAYLSAGSCIMIGITAHHYNIHTGQILSGTGAQNLEIAVPTLLLALGIGALLVLPPAGISDSDAHP